MSEPMHPQQSRPPMIPQPPPAQYPQTVPAQPGYPPPAQYPQTVPAQSGYPQVTVCRICASMPAAKATFRGHRGMILLMQFRSLPGPFCRDCGVAAFRQMTADTMWQGWWGVASMFITPVVLLINVVLRNRVTALPPPQPNPWGTSVHPANPGRPLLARPGALVGLIPVTGFVILAFAVLLAIITNR